MSHTTRRPLELVVLSDLHLGTYGCHANELLQYLRSIQPERLVLNGDIIDIWQFKKRFWPRDHTRVIRELLNFITNGTEVYYITGNHDELMRRFSGFEVQNFQIVNKLVLELDNHKKAWIFHGDVFDITMKYSVWLAKLGAVGYDMLIYLNRFVNKLMEKMGRGKISLSKRIKNSVKSAVKFISDFEDTAASIAIENHFDYVVCGHIHQPVIQTMHNVNGYVEYLNAGDWVENLTALEYHNGQWKLFEYNEADLKHQKMSSSGHLEETLTLNNSQLFNKVVQEFSIF